MNTHIPPVCVSSLNNETIARVPVGLSSRTRRKSLDPVEPVGLLVCPRVWNFSEINQAPLIHSISSTESRPDGVQAVLLFSVQAQSVAQDPVPALLSRSIRTYE